MERTCYNTIKEMIALVPKVPENKEFRLALLWNMEDSAFKAPESNIQWERTYDTLIKYIAPPFTEVWKAKIWSAFSLKPLEEILLSAKPQESETE